MRREELFEFYNNCALPCIGTDRNLNLCFCNDAAKSDYPALCTPNGLDLLIPPFEREGLIAVVSLTQTARFRGYDPVFSEESFVITAVGEDYFIINPAPKVGTENDISDEMLSPSYIFNNLEGMLRTEISSIFSVLPPLAEAVKESGAVDKLPTIDVISQSSYRVLRSIVNVLDYRKLTGPTFTLDKRVFDISLMLKEAVAIIDNIIDSSDISIKLISDDSPIMVDGDYEKILNALIQIISNAIKFPLSSGKIKIILKKVNGKVNIKVSDNGFGMNPEVLKNCKSPFYTYNYDGKVCIGAGLGLTIAELIAEYHGGEILIDSSPKGGTSVTLSIPEIKDGSLAVKSVCDRSPSYSSILILLSDCCRIPYDI